MERFPVERQAGEVLTGATMVFRAAPGRTSESLQRLVDCQSSMASKGVALAPPQKVALCPLAVTGVTATVRDVSEGLAVDVRPTDRSASKRVSHSLTHGLAARELASFESNECRGVPPKERAACPLLGPVTMVRDVPAGVEVDFPASVSTKPILAGMRCHYSFAKARNFSVEASACPLYMSGLHLAETADGQGVDITITPPSRAADLRRRVREEAVFAPGAIR
jgi:hypothetical protein